jgi:hypothetical protein
MIETVFYMIDAAFLGFSTFLYFLFTACKVLSINEVTVI